MKLHTISAALAGAMALVACGGGGGSSSSSGSSTLSGSVADGYLSGAKVCLDKNKNGACDTGEPTTTTGSGGAYSLSGLSESDAGAYPLVVEVPASAVDSDTGAAVGKSFVLKAPAGKSGFVSPISTLVQQKLDSGAATTVDAAVAAVKADLAAAGQTAPADLFANYLSANDTGTHTIARTLTASVKTYYEAVKDGLSSNAQIKALQDAALTQAMSDLRTGTRTGLATVTAAVVAKASADTASQSAATQDVTINFDVVNGGASVRCGDVVTLPNTQLWDHTPTNTSAVAATTQAAQTSTGKLVDLRFYVSNVALVDQDGNATPVVLTENAGQSKGLALLNFGYNTVSSGATYANVTCSPTTGYVTSITGKVKPGTYTGVTMVVGVPLYGPDMVRQNHSNAADTANSLPLQNSAMAWSWQSGRKFTKLEFWPTTPVQKPNSSTTSKWVVHLGSTGCSGDPTVGTTAPTSCTNPNRVKLAFSSFNASSQKVVLDIGQLFKNSDLQYDAGGAAGCMSGTTDPECGPIFKALGLDLSTGVMSTTVAQSVFSVK